MTEQNIPLWEVFIRSRTGLAHRHVGSVHAVDAEMALELTREAKARSEAASAASQLQNVRGVK